MATGTVAQGQLRSPSDKNERELHGYYSHVEGKRSHVEGKRSYHHPRDGPVQGKLIGGGEAEPGEYPYYGKIDSFHLYFLFSPALPTNNCSVTLPHQ